MVKLPNGFQMTIHMAGTIVFSTQLYLHDVLYIPAFTFNLVSVSKLAKSLDCHLTFNGDSCMIQDINTLKMIGATESRGGLYYLTVETLQLPSTHTVNTLPFLPLVIFDILDLDTFHMRNLHTYMIYFL